jgi:hypothetical protein
LFKNNNKQFVTLVYNINLFLLAFFVSNKNTQKIPSNPNKNRIFEQKAFEILPILCYNIFNIGHFPGF